MMRFVLGEIMLHLLRARNNGIPAGERFPVQAVKYHNFIR